VCFFFRKNYPEFPARPKKKNGAPMLEAPFFVSFMFFLVASLND